MSTAASTNADVPVQSSWTAIAEAKCAQRDALLKPEWTLPASVLPPPSDLDVTHVPAASGILTPLELQITDAHAETILSNVAGGVWTAESVAVAFCKRATIAQQLVNCLTEVCFDEAIERARELDNYLKETGRTVGPLHGLPVSVKDCFKIKGLDSTLGFIAWANKPAENESVIVTLLRDAGAVIHCKTNVPTAMMMPETYNNIFGRTLNPYNRKLSPGGSTGGEGALLAMRGSAVGFGTDVGGSIRIPGAFCGLYSLLPSGGRFPIHNTPLALAGQEALNVVVGPMGTDLHTLTIVSEAIIGKGQPWRHDPKALPIPWRTPELPEKLSIGVFRDDGLVKPHPPVDRALTVVIDALTKAGHEVIPFEPYEHAKGVDFLGKFFGADGGTSVRKVIEASGEDWPAGLQGFKDGAKFHPSTYDLWQIQKARTDYQKAYLEHWKATQTKTSTGREVDFILGPVTPYAASQHDKFEYGGYTFVWNVLDWSTATIPVLRADHSLDVRSDEYESYTPKSPTDESIWRSYDPSAVANAPVGLQLIGRRLEEEKVLAGCAVVEQALKDAGRQFT